ncbi:right-handed parallel beta-helix repeat-containing protein [uncultured Methanobrevibacter sp.]|uniref:right-handed parallel beta-helix repeat-containing protein n=1 Tax=uncultured Methanobrevibacter sp. TaxID=253161 RepID=UPI002631496C|nr:right-handed parallel beta-helix repeat-containing protein [uncultured Methanobrevibacter sp.]
MEFKKSMIIIMLAVFFISIANVSASDANETAIATDQTTTIEIFQNEEISLNDNNQAIGQSNDKEIISQANTGTFTDLQNNIAATSPNSTLELDRNYEYNDDFDTKGITIDRTITIDGKGHTIDAKGQARVFNIRTSDVTIKNLTIKNANYNGDGGAVYFAQSGRVINCNFTNNTASNYGGAINFEGSGTVKNCNFTDNHATASSGGAIWIYSGTVENCNFTNNTATYGHGGAVNFCSKGNVSNCNFNNNQATIDGGAIWIHAGTVENCNFTNNTASNGGAIYFIGGYVCNVSNCNFLKNSANWGGAILSYYMWAATADTCIFKTDSDSHYQVHILSPTLNVDNFTDVFNSGRKLTFDLKTNSSMPVYNGNISISVYSNNEWVGNYSCLSGEGWIPDLPVGFYIAVFNTEYEEFQPINRTIKIIPNIPYYVNVTPVTTNNKIVNITAKSNIPNDIIQGILRFILPNGTEISANYTGGIWWAVHTFDDYGDYQVNASYTELSNVTITNATISISKASLNLNATYNVSVLDDGFAVNIIINSDPVVNGNLTIKFNGGEYPAELVNGVANFTSKKVYSKTYKTDIFYHESDQYLNSSTTLNAVVKSTKVTRLNTFTYYYYNTDMGSDSKKGISKIKVIDVDGNPIKSGVLTINFMDMYRLKVRTDASGIAEFTKAYKPGTYTVIAQHNNKTTKLGNLVIKSVVNLPKLSKVSKSAKTTTIKITLKGTGPIKGKSVIVTFMKKQYTIKTDKNGVAQFKVTQSMVSKLIAGKTYKIRATYMMDSVAQGIQILK